MRKKMLRYIKKIVIAAIGLLVICIGIILLFYPGPGWLVIFAGLAVLATEFEPVQDLLSKGRDLYDKWQKWVFDQHWFMRLLLGITTFILATLMTWLLDGFGLINQLLNLHLDWLASPLFH